MSVPTTDGVTAIIKKAKSLGASLAGIASVASLKDSPSYAIYDQSPYYESYEKVEWPVEAKSVLVLALLHDPSEPELDWWDDKPGRTPGNRQLMSMAKSLKQWMNDEFGINARPLPYRVEQGGILLKDAAVLAGLGTIGKNNLVITPQFGPRVRLRALFLDVDLEPTGPIDFDPCEGCDMPCRRACPRKAFRNGSYSRALCDLQMGEDEANEVIIENWGDGGSPGRVRKYCRACELACPVAR
ncbi:MAG: epoxyqueuosine reductase [Anaerolineae bacterium]